MVVIPTLLTNENSINDLVEKLEIRFLANRDANLCFALLTDFRDGPYQFARTINPCFKLYKIRSLN